MRARALPLLLGLACNSADSATSTSFGGGPGGPAGGASPGTDFGSSVPELSSTTVGVEDSAGSGGASGGTTLLLDVGGMPDLGNSQPVGCKGKIDVLFVISRHFNMEYKQAHLSEQFPKLIDAITERFEDFDYHIMAVDGDEGWGLWTCDENCTPEACPVEDYPCELLDTVSACDEAIGAGTVFNAGWLAHNQPCMIAGGNRYMVKGQPDIKETFACLATMGVSGRGDLLEAMASALSPALTGPGGCNVGFLRDEALLLVVFLPSGYDQSSSGDQWGWAKAVREAKKGDLESVVFLYFGWLCQDPENDRICQLRDHFPLWVLGDVDAADYGPAMNDAADLVSEACASFIPK